MLPSKNTFMNSFVDSVNHVFDSLPSIDNEESFQELLPLKQKIDDCYGKHSGDYKQELQILAI